jgi:hypothetical protein
MLSEKRYCLSILKQRKAKSYGAWAQQKYRCQVHQDTKDVFERGHRPGDQHDAHFQEQEIPRFDGVRL